jgi:hypothetical protein
MHLFSACKKIKDCAGARTKRQKETLPVRLLAGLIYCHLRQA